MGGSGSKTKGAWPFSCSASGGEASGDPGEQCLARLRGSKNATPFIFTRRSSLYFDEDGDLAHEFYEETVGIVKLDHPRIHVDFPVILCEI
ncbi:hypothetical protein DNTS_025612 [Danionella cerebrum]|uniref:Tumor suppressor candidate 2 n=1 Tax=Danionella cerebrum TaxID=2873325 RepID=A0A553QA86_9TELE|nr:hypothetical protein DNTS_025612 [Danionella translucida]